ncbi:MAG: transposase [Propionivibrio sp.]|nr:transposase [Propionivibrio sp.]
MEGDYPSCWSMPCSSRAGRKTVVSRAVLTVSGIRADGYREILFGVRIGDTESFATWDETFRWLRSRGLKGTMFIISDDYGGLREAAARYFQGAMATPGASDATFSVNAAPVTAPR